MSRGNNKELSVNYENSIKKSNEISMAKLSQGLTLNQMQLLAFAIYSTQQDGKTEFRKFEFQNKFEIQKYQTINAHDDAERLINLKFSIEDLDNDKFEFYNVFESIKYDKGFFSFSWTSRMIPHILELKEKYVTTDLTITSQFRSGFSWILYDYLRARFGYWKIELSKDACMRLFGVEDKVTYQRNTGRFKTSVLNPAINEINKFTELEVWYTDLKKGRSIIGFELNWSVGNRSTGATEKQLSLLREIHDEVERKVFDYLSLEDSNSLKIASSSVLKIKKINDLIDETLASKKAKELIKEAKMLYEQLESLLDQNGKKRDTSVYFNWLEETKEK